MVEQDYNLKGILDGLLKSHRNDIYAYSSGHLNSNNLKKQESEQHQEWETSKKPVVQQITKKQKIKSHSSQDPQQEWMKSTIAAFSIGVDSRIPDGPGTQKKKRKKEPQKQQTDKDSEVSKGSAGTDGDGRSLESDGVLIEEIKLPEVMLARTMYGRKKDWVEYEEDPLKEKKPVSQGHIKDVNLSRHYSPRHQFLSGHQQTVTKRDQYILRKSFEKKILRTQDNVEQKVLLGNQAVERHERKLRQLLEMQQTNTSQSSIERLQLYVETFDDIIRDSTSFGYILQLLKDEYDLYLNYLLHNYSGRHLVLQDQIDSLTKRVSYRPLALELEQNKLKTLEEEARNAIEYNERLRAQLEEERRRTVTTTDKPTTCTIYYSEPIMETSDHIEEVHANIMERLDEIEKERKIIREKYIPTNIVTHLEQSIKDTEVEIQKLMGQKDYFERNTKELEAELTQVIEEADTTERDARRVWKKISSVKSQSDPDGRGLEGGQYQDDSDEDYNEESKWTWYIS